MTNLTDKNIDAIVSAIRNVSADNPLQAVHLDNERWFSIFKSTESKKDGELDVLLMNGCASTPFMFFVYQDDKDLSAVVEQNVTRLLNEFDADLNLEEEFELER